ncbi:type VI secretion system-associated lipoprotein [Thioalkalivibrio denitrificans]|uniref:Type VI secretion system-associated lipoprotein n=1 Tax=Thioalkalivibrio denitrificans TaxID=108003 RepID=A0A1V3NF20_9GAMM|nr:type VI secretion system lipoprotein TssJ [Thioalkalivibrio denitrificans]OOG23478.1 type VI secretion system-associated lipoprotein [Thioalkalivibrio denitrificans]
MNPLTLRSGVLVLLVLLLAACSGPQVRVDLSSTANLNMSDEGNPLPVVVRVYQLADARNFTNATFESLWKQDVQSLGDAALTREEMILNPGTTHELELKRNPQAEYVGVVAIFRAPEDDGWRAIRPLPMGQMGRRMNQRVTVSLRGNSLSIVD